MQVLYGDSYGEIELSGTPGDLMRLADLIRLPEGDSLLDTSVDPSPYSRTLSAITSRRTSGGLVVSAALERAALVIQGGVESLERLASILDAFAAEGDSTAHLHIEYVSEHGYISERSEPLVIALKAS
jgi:hypothetical protein